VNRSEARAAIKGAPNNAVGTRSERDLNGKISIEVEVAWKLVPIADDEEISAPIRSCTRHLGPAFYVAEERKHGQSK
jgi:hypothetical protein